MDEREEDREDIDEALERNGMQDDDWKHKLDKENSSGTYEMDCLGMSFARLHAFRMRKIVTIFNLQASIWSRSFTKIHDGV